MNRPSSRPRRLAIVGCGAIAGAHAEAVLSNPGTTLIGVVDNNAEVRDSAAAVWNCPGFSSVDDLLAAVDPEAACVCTPPSSHRALAERLLEYGSDVLCEKPLAHTLVEATAMCSAAERLGRVLMVSQKFAHVEDLVEAGSLLRSGEIGTPTLYGVAICHPVPMQGRWNVDAEVAGGGVVMDNGSHAFDMLNHVLMSPIEEVSAAFSVSTVNPAVEDTAVILFRTSEGTVGRISLSWTSASKDLDYLVVHGTEGTLRVGWTGGQVRRHDEADWRAFGSGYNKAAAFAGQLDVFLAAMKARRTSESYDNDPLANALLVDRTYEAEASRSWVRVLPV